MIRSDRILQSLSTVFIGIAIIISVGIIAGTVWALASGKGKFSSSTQSLFDRGGQNPAREEVIAADRAGKTAIFGDIGPLRAVTADTEPVIILCEPFFPYLADDLAFREELVQKTRNIRTLLLGWFRTHAIAEVKRLGEDGVKAELIREINTVLVLGHIDILYFDEYMVF